jgi:hypothetical protein
MTFASRALAELGDIIGNNCRPRPYVGLGGNKKLITHVIRIDEHAIAHSKAQVQ